MRPVCGIAGQVRFDGAPVSEPLVERMCRAMVHRGPDSRGVFVRDGVGLGAQRLRVIDLQTGDQPIRNEDGSVVVVLNGEIFNFRELRTRLQRNGHAFITGTDTEVIAHLYEEEGVDCVASLNGMFAFAVWDAPRRRLMLARDRTGEKPLFYAHRGHVLSFGSELNALMKDDTITRELDDQGLDAYLAYGWIPGPRSAFRAVRKLPPASTMVFDGGPPQIDCYWRLNYGRKLEVCRAEELHEPIRAALRRAVSRRMIADVPIGAFLSGGIDSSAIVAAMAQASPQPVKTFSIGFEADALDERQHARAVARRFGTDHHELLVRADAITTIPEVVRRHGEPFGDPAALPMFHLARMARPHVTVALSGDGGDESFAGYSRYAANALLGRLDRLPLPGRRAAAAMARRLPKGATIDGALNRARRMGAGLALDPAARYVDSMGGLTGLDRDALYTGEFRERLRGWDAAEILLDPWRRSTGTSVVDRMLDVDVNTYLPDNHLVKTDIATMAHSLEARAPMLDHELMELVASVPSQMKVKGLQKKVLLRDALRGWLDDDVLDRPKQGFQLPIADWFRGELREWARDILLDRAARSRGYFCVRHVEDLLDSHADGQRDHALAIWTLVIFELWHCQCVDGV